MADIQLRFNQDMLIVSSPIRAQLQSLGLDTDRDMEMTLLLEPEVLDEIYTLDVAVGVQCLVADTTAITPARLAQLRLNVQGKAIAESAINAAAGTNPQHILAEIGPCGLPLDASSKASLMENRDQYVRAAGFLADVEPLFDAYFLNKFTSITELKCALMGLRKVTDKPIFASVLIEDSSVNCSMDGGIPTSSMNASLDPSIDASTIKLASITGDSLASAIETIIEYGGQVVGFETACNPCGAANLAKAVRQHTAVLPIMAQLHVRSVNPEQGAPTADNPYFEADTMVDAADALRESGVQFIRAVGNAKPAYTGALVAATLGDEVLSGSGIALPARHEAASEDLTAFGDELRNKINAALNARKN